MHPADEHVDELLSVRLRLQESSSETDDHQESSGLLGAGSTGEGNGGGGMLGLADAGAGGETGDAA